MDLLFDLLALPLVGIVEALAGLHWPSEDPVVRRLQRVIQAFLAVALVALFGAATLAYTNYATGYRVLILLVITCVCLIAAGIVGNTVEKRCKRKS